MSFILHVRKFVVVLAAMVSLVILPEMALAQKKTVSGTVVDDGGNSLPGVSIMEKGTTNGTTSDSDGKYTMNVSSDATLVFSFIGMKSSEVLVGNQTVIDITLAADMETLDEVIVVGYGTTKKSDLIGSVASIAADDIRKMPVSNVAEALTGRMAGVHVSSPEGSPDAEISIRIRGGTSISQSNSPLFIVDGFPMDNINDISASDIESMSVLKDASSTAIYGSRGANGVVIITTKGGGTDGKISVSYNAFVGAKEIAKTLDVLDPSDYVNWQYEYAMLRHDGALKSYEDFFGLYSDRDLYQGIKGNDWQRQIYGRTGKVFSNDLSVRGGTEKFNYSLNYARFQEKGIMLGSGMKRDNITLKMNNKATDKINIGFTLRYSKSQVEGGGANEKNEASSADSRLKHIVSYAPIPIPGIVADADDTNEEVTGDLTNPIRAIWDNDRYQERTNFNVGANVEWKIIDNLKLKVEGGLDNNTNLDNRFYGLTTYYSKNQGGNAPAVIMADGKSVRMRNTNTLNYDFKGLINNKAHSLNILLGYEVLVTQSSRLTSTIHGYDDFYTSKNAFKLTAQGTPVSVHNNFEPDDKLLSFFTRMNYSYKGRYLLDAVYRADGSSRFLGDNVWGYFPSISAGWKVSEEAFMQNVSSWLHNVKLRASYGSVGNNNIPRGQTFQFFEPGSGTSLTWGNNINNYWAASKTMANADLKWETTYTRNIGLDFGLFNNRITSTIEIYKNTTEDLLLRYPTTGTGYDDQFRNLGTTQNKGVEISLTYAIIDRPNYGLNISVNSSFNRNEIISLGGLKQITAGTNSNWASTQIASDYEVKVGNSVGMMYGYVNDGRYEVSDFEGYDGSEWVLKEGVPAVIAGLSRPGMMKLKDISGPDGTPDGVVDGYDQKVIGNFTPKHVGGFTLNGHAYGFDLTASFNYSYGNDVYNANKVEYTTNNQNNQYRNLISTMEQGKRWTNINEAGQLVNDPTELAALNANTTMWSPYMNRYFFSDWAVEDGSFLRLNTLTLGYTVPKDIVSKLRISNVRAYVTGYNVFLWTNYSGFDPEVSTRRNTPYTPGVDFSAYPRSKQIVFGLNFNF